MTMAVGGVLFLHKFLCRPKAWPNPVVAAQGCTPLLHPKMPTLSQADAQPGRVVIQCALGLAESV